MPAQIPSTGIPDSIFSFRALSEPLTKESCPIVVLSPPGMINPSN